MGTGAVQPWGERGTGQCFCLFSRFNCSDLLFSSPLGYNMGSEDAAKGSEERETDRPRLKFQHCWMPWARLSGPQFPHLESGHENLFGVNNYYYSYYHYYRSSQGRGASYLFKPWYPKIPRRRMLTKLPKDARKMDKSDNSETWTSRSRRAWAEGDPPSASH